MTRILERVFVCWPARAHVVRRLPGQVPPNWSLTPTHADSAPPVTEAVPGHLLPVDQGLRTKEPHQEVVTEAGERAD